MWILCLSLFFAGLQPPQAPSPPSVAEGDFVIRNFRFTSGESLPELRIHYVIDAIRKDPEWKDGYYAAQPQSVRVAAQMLWLVGSNPILRQNQAPTLADADRVLDQYVANYFKTWDANDILYALEASRDYAPGPGLENIKAPLLAVNSADDIINPPELLILEREIKRVSKGRAMVLPLSDRTTGHGTHTQAALWKHYLEELLRASIPDR